MKGYGWYGDKSYKFKTGESVMMGFAGFFVCLIKFSGIDHATVAQFL